MPFGLLGGSLLASWWILITLTFLVVLSIVYLVEGAHLCSNKARV